MMVSCVMLSHGVVFELDYSNSPLPHFTTKRNIDAHNKIEMSVYEFIIFIVCNDITVYFFQVRQRFQQFS